jgi:hypothetical protein
MKLKGGKLPGRPLRIRTWIGIGCVASTVLMMRPAASAPLARAVAAPRMIPRSSVPAIVQTTLTREAQHVEAGLFAHDAAFQNATLLSTETLYFLSIREVHGFIPIYVSPVSVGSPFVAAAARSNQTLGDGGSLRANGGEQATPDLSAHAVAVPAASSCSGCGYAWFYEYVSNYASKYGDQLRQEFDSGGAGVTCDNENCTGALSYGIYDGTGVSNDGDALGWAGSWGLNYESAQADLSNGDGACSSTASYYVAPTTGTSYTAGWFGNLSVQQNSNVDGLV